VPSDVIQFAAVSFTTLLVVVDPFGVLPLFVAYTAGRTRAQRQAILHRAIGVALVVSLLFLLAGHRALAYLGVSVHAFAISGGILLFMTAVPMLFGQRPGTQASSPGESPQGDVAVFPLAIPLLAGPGTITSILILTARGDEDLVHLAILAATIVLVFLLSWMVLGVASGWLLRRLGDTGLHVLSRVLGILLAALAVQFVLNGVTDYVAVLRAASGG
jgi:multiple antibiotic resistance protein